MIPFADRRDAGRQLGELLSKYAYSSLRVVVLGLPRGGVPVAFEVARKLRCALDVFIVRKLGVPAQPELAMGAIASGGIIVRNDDVIRHLGISEETFAAVAERENEELARREVLYRGEREEVSVDGAICIIVDDGIATGASMRAAIAALRTQRPARIFVAAPVAAPSVKREFEAIADRVFCVYTPPEFSSVGAWYEDFDQTSNEEVAQLLSDSNQLIKDNGIRGLDLP